MNDPYIKPGSVGIFTDSQKSGWTWETINGVRIVSALPPTQRTWWDDHRLHIIWSYSSWTTLILSQAGYLADEKGAPAVVGKALKFPRKYLKSKGWW